MRVSAPLLLSLLFAGCTRSAPDGKASAPSASTLAASTLAASTLAAVASSAPVAAPVEGGAVAAEDAAAWPAALVKPTMPAPGPMKVVGYPADLRTCLPDPAEHAGFTKDGSELGYCVKAMNTRCELVDRDGKRRTMSSARSDDSPGSDPAKERTIAAFIKDAGLPALARKECVLRPASPVGSWAYPDIVVNVVTVAPTWKKGPASSEDQLAAQPLVRLGGALTGEAPVYPVTYSAPHRALTAPTPGEIPYNVTELNALALSPDGLELGVVVHANCMEWCDDFQVVRMPASRFASLVYNDTGYRALSKGQLERAAELFLRAAYVDASRELPAYNLACTYARQGDARAEAALALAIARGGATVRERAGKDKDFDGVRTAPWFVKLSGASR